MVESGNGARLVTFSTGASFCFLIIVGRTVLAIGAGGGCFDYHLPLFLSFHID